MSQQLNELEQRIGYNFGNREHLRRALTCQSAINERHPDATNENFQALEFIGDAALKYAVATLLYTAHSHVWSAGDMHNKVVPYINNANLSRIGRDLNLSQYIVKGNGVTDVTNKMLADAVEAILGAIVVDQQEQEHEPNNVLFDVVARLWSIKWNGKLLSTKGVQHYSNENKCCCCCESSCGKFFGILFILLLVVGLIALAVFSRKAGDL